MNHLLREKAPITEAGWNELDGEAQERLEPGLAARKVVDFGGPHGWDYSATNLGRVAALTGFEGVAGLRRRVLPWSRCAWTSRIAAPSWPTSSGAPTTSTSGRSTRRRGTMAQAENVAVFHGWLGAGIRGIAEACTHPAVALGEDFNRYTRHIAEAVETLLRAGVSGPYALALGPDQYTGVIQTHRARRLPALRPPEEDPRRRADRLGARRARGGRRVVRGGDFLFESGQDLSIGYDHHDAETVHLYLQESFSFRVATPEAACFLKPVG